MTLEYLSVLAVIAIFSVIQSFFGMGVLVFGTPTLLLMGYDFTTTLGYLLPASFAISLLQVFAAGPNRAHASKYLYLLCLPGIVAGLWIVESSPVAAWTNILVGVTLLLSALIRSWEKSRELFTDLLKKHYALYHLGMGLIHGMTNLGGALLAILAGGTNSDKNDIRNTIALYYLAFSTIQMLFLVFVLGLSGMLVGSLPLAGVAAIVYLLIGNRIFSQTGNLAFNSAMTVFIAIYGLVILLRV